MRHKEQLPDGSENAEGDNSARPHQGLDQQIPVSSNAPSGSGPVHCRIVLGGILHDYYREAA
jgi:hypothetical protein